MYFCSEGISKSDLARNSIIRSMDLTESFQLEDDTTLTEEEKKEAEQLQKDEQLRRSDPVAYSALLFQRRQTQATMPMMATPGGQYLNPRVLEGSHAGALPGQETLLSAYGPRDPMWQTAIATAFQVQDRPSVATQPQMEFPSSSEASDFERKRAAENLAANTIMSDLNPVTMSPVLAGHTTVLPPQALPPTLFEHLSRSVTPSLRGLSISPSVCTAAPYAHNES